ncbi:hypothetical protein DIZ81_04870 [Legionella taurinensis]|uniref:Uncharacterized protein n=1 Tax=Legionella taurinensis TaxID=70611 RepID=A0A3A5L5T1_9GAMM|nr:hypothetical protein [Legionella taurinensis]MDX1837004.1 hypothetical protein [Legionella taurinensis]PUT41410.1 hypothetical protein DB744_04870 [Legionella taurinensis]PUT42649.1 hypothetical protein DB746_07205 [Legionella taurinensis]PUT46677.1 hypothetical protein DB743_04605 [Legionella taurinensis]PUT47326.1 hypothetical protein DB745_08285 [Legionella taurinensis]
MLSKFGLFKDYASVNTVKKGFNLAGLLVSGYEVYSNALQEDNPLFVFGFLAHGYTLLSLRDNASDVEKNAALLLNSSLVSCLIISLLIDSKVLPVPVQVVDLGVHLLNILTAPLPNGNEENHEQEATAQAKMK